MTDSYFTLSGSSCEETVISRSRFIGYASPSSCEEEAVSFLRQIQEKHKTATHHCYAYIIGENSGIMRYSDDGEPGGTAGMPIMDVLRTKKLVNCCIVVVRYFGGVLLGTGGLVRAYTRSAQLAVEAAGIACMELTSGLICDLPYSVWDRFRYAAERLPVRLADISYGSSVSFRILFRSRDRETVFPKLVDAADRKWETIECEESFSAWKTDP